MFTNEIEWTESITTIMDESGQLEDFQVFIDDTGIYMRQFNETSQTYDLICLSHDMFRDFNLALDEGEGMFRVE
jgi:uncharacterized protein YihD (DUF1040 family)